MMITDLTFALLRHPYRIVQLPLDLIQDKVMDRIDPEGPARSLLRWALESSDGIDGNPLRGRISETESSDESASSDTSAPVRTVCDLAAKRNQALRAKLEAREIAEFEAIEEVWAATRDRMRVTCELALEATATAVHDAQQERTAVIATAGIW
jgi:hypothetical protein